jgi:hypothetical protein
VLLLVLENPQKCQVCACLILLLHKRGKPPVICFVFFTTYFSYIPYSQWTHLIIFLRLHDLPDSKCVFV